MSRFSPAIAPCAVLAFFLCAATSLGAQNLYFKNTVELPAGDVRLGDVARVEGDPALARRLLFRDLKRPRYLSARELRESSAADGLSFQNIYGAGVWIIPLGRELTETELTALLIEQIRALPDGADALQKFVIRVAPNSRVSAPADGVRLNFRLPGRAASLSSGRRIVPLDITPEGGERAGEILARRQIQAIVLRVVQVPVARRDLRIGERLSAADYAYERRELEGEEVRYPSGDLSGRRVMAGLQAGEALSDSHVQILPAVRRGQQLRLVYQSPGIVLRLRASALEDGEVGRTIRVQPLFPSGARSDTLKARIVSEDSALIEDFSHANPTPGAP